MVRLPIQSQRLLVIEGPHHDNRVDPMLQGHQPEVVAGVLQRVLGDQVGDLAAVALGGVGVGVWGRCTLQWAVTSTLMGLALM